MLLSCGFVDGCSWQLGLAAGDLTGLPNEILQQVAIILGQKEDLGLFDDAAKVGHKVAALFRKFG